MIELPPDFYRNISGLVAGRDDKKYLRRGDLSLPAMPLTPTGGNTASNGRKLKTRPPPVARRWFHAIAMQRFLKWLLQFWRHDFSAPRKCWAEN
jgi:hypothetical protein